MRRGWKALLLVTACSGALWLLLSSVAVQTALWSRVLRSATPAKILFSITVSGSRDALALSTLLRALWHQDNLYLLHVDAKALASEMPSIRNVIKQVAGADPKNIKLVDNPVQVSWGRFSMLLTALHGLSSAIGWSSQWDFWINLSPADMPLLTADEMRLVLGALSRDRPVSFMGCTRPDWEQVRPDRRHTYMDDEGLYRSLPKPRGRLSVIQHAPKPMRGVARPPPDLFDVYKGEFWVVLHRSLAEYIHHSPDNVARSVYLYLAATYISDELFFQTVACHPKLPASFHIINDSLRFIRWPPKSRGHPATIDDVLLEEALASGALFARKFDHRRAPDSALALKAALNDPQLSLRRMALTMMRTYAKGREDLC
eukprot:TRINITY_DN24977_c0_g1_i1.p1 TRINITY_DN24977_c0_g1~~TRINITY_DN24977_c0_g1_i1.p1  ORF type:complete len:372 (-),score=31.25 TRINITY_DN24977_c0_g1_i1:34-1149(-)